MKLKVVVAFICMIFMTNMLCAQNDGYTLLWDKVRQSEEASLPQSAMETVNQIYQKAVNEKNSPELIKALMHKLKYELVVDRDQAPEMMREIEKYTKTVPDVAEQSMLHSVLAHLYMQYYQANSYRIRQRTPVAGFVPEDMREWTGNIFAEKIAEHIDASVAGRPVLQTTDVLKYKAILQEGDASRKLRPTLYDFLMNQGVELYAMLGNDWMSGKTAATSSFSDVNVLAPADVFVQQIPTDQAGNYKLKVLNLYREWLTFRLKANNPAALLNVDLDRLEYAFANLDIAGKDEVYVAALLALKDKYKSCDCCVEAIYRLANYYAYQADKEPVVPYREDEIEETPEKRSFAGQAKAYQLCLDGIKSYPDYERVGLLKNLLNQLTLSSVNVSSDNTVYPGKELEIKVTFVNTKQLTIAVYKINQPVSAYANAWDAGQFYKTGKLVETKTIQLHNEHPYITYDTIIKLKTAELGCYEYVVTADRNTGQVSSQQFSVSRLATFCRGYSEQREVLVVDRISGKPAEGATVCVYKQVKNKNVLAGTFKTGKDGLATVSKDNNIHAYNVVLGNDSASILSPLPWSAPYQPMADKIENLSLFTDRGIYRPGQTVYFKGIACNLEKTGSKVLSGKQYVIVLRDVNGKEVMKKTLKTNKYGSFSGEFMLPSTGLTGYFSIGTEDYNQQVSFRVEEYKRPTFDISFPPLDKTVKFGDFVSVKGEAKTFSGVMLQSAEVSYRVIKRPHWFWRIYGREEQVAQGTVKTDDNGMFTISFLAEKSLNDKSRKDVYYTYSVEATVMNAAGETQTASTSVSVGDKSMILAVDIQKNILDKDKLEAIAVKATNLNGVNVDCSGHYAVYQLEGNPVLSKNPKPVGWKQGKQVASGTFHTNEKLNLQLLKQLSSGYYRMTVSANDDQNREVTAKNDFVLYSEKDKTPPITTYEWLLTPKTECAVGENAVIIYGSSAKTVDVLYDVFKDGEKLETKRFILNNEMKRLDIPFKESYGEGVTVSFTFVKDEQLFTNQVNLTRKKENKKLDVELSVFRDKLLPGQKEEWRLTVKDSGNPVVAEVLAGMYDASLDKIQMYQWNFNPLWSSASWAPYPQRGMDFETRNGYLAFPQEGMEIPSLVFDALNLFGINFYPQTTLRNGFGGIRIKGAGGVAVDESFAMRESAPAAPAMKMMSANQVQMADIATEGGRQTSAEQPVALRQNFNETAFFFPQLMTNDAGETQILFTVPESNTTWKFMALAHTPDLKFGQLVKEAVSQKKLMVAPNLPRFVRHGDKTTISTTISNLTEETLNGNIRLVFFDPNTTRETIALENGGTQLFTVEAGKTIPVSWSFEVPSGIDMTACKIVATAGNFSDGEQHLLPVLPNRMLVTESLPMTVRGNQNKDFTLEKLAKNKSASLENYRLALEFTANPVWYAVQALPAMTTPQNDNAVSWFAAYFSNKLATSIANSTPKIKQIIDAWTKQGGTKETLLSNLEKNQELKAVLLEETPWVLEAQNESEQKQRLALLFDINRSQNLTSAAIQKLTELQLPEGGWPWFKGMYPNVSMTQWMLYGMGHLKQLNVTDADELENIQEKGVRFIDEKFQEEFVRFKKTNPKWKETQSFSTFQLEYLFVRSYYKNIPFGEADEAVSFYTKLVEKYWSKNTSLYTRALAAMLMKRNGNNEIAGKIIQSLKEHATNKEELGMYWANNSASAFRFQSATAIHTFIMQAFAENGASAKEMDEMKIWLLKQKQTQEWESVPATVDAVYVLLKTGTNWLNQSNFPEIKWGGNAVETAGSEIGTGYLKQVRTTSEITPAMSEIAVSNTNAGPAWGALYWQYYENLDQITSAKTGLNVEKKLFTEQITANGKSLIEVTSSQPLKVGDKAMVRLTVRNDRDMEYVMLKDMRGACFEPVEQLSGAKWKEQVVYYQSMKDASVNFFFDHLPKGTYVFEYPLYVTRSGEYSNGVTTIQCLYAPEFVSHTAGERVNVKN